MEKIYTVSELNRSVKKQIEKIPDFKEFFLSGEMSNISYYKSGHLYFSLKDKKATVKCVSFNYKAKKIVTNLKEGDKVKIFGTGTNI